MCGLAQSKAYFSQSKHSKDLKNKTGKTIPLKCQLQLSFEGALFTLFFKQAYTYFLLL